MDVFVLNNLNEQYIHHKAFKAKICPLDVIYVTTFRKYCDVSRTQKMNAIVHLIGTQCQDRSD